MTREGRLNGLSVLVLEDDYYLADDVCQALTDAGATVLGPVPNSADAQLLLERHRPDCALLDVNLGDGPDFTLAERLLRNGVPMVLVSGYDRAVVPAELFEIPYLTKPAELRAIVAAVEQACVR